MTIQQFIEKAIEGGWYPKERHWENISLRTGDTKPRSLTKTVTASITSYQILLDPEAWKAVGKVEGKKICICGTQGPLHTQQCPCAAIKAHATYQMHRMIDALAEGKTIEQYLLTL